MLNKKFITNTILSCFISVFVFGAVMAPRPALAVIPLPVQEVGATGATIIARDIKLSIGQTILASALVGMINTVTLVAQQFAYDLAVGLASGCRGENACAFTKDPGTYFTAVTYDAAGEFIGNLTGPWEELGFNLCSPRIPEVGLSIALGLAERFQRPTPKCDFVRTIDNWQNVIAEAKDPHQLLKHVSLAFEPGNTDIGQALEAATAFRLQVEKKQQAEMFKRLEGGGILAQSGIISGNITTPAQVMRQNFNELATQGKDQQITSGQIVGQTLASGEVWSAVGTTVLSTFTNTLLSRMLRSAISGIFGETATTLPDLTALAGAMREGIEGGRPGPGLSAVARALLTPQIRPAGGTMDYISELSACPSDRKLATQFNCAIDSQFAAALQRSRTGPAITVKEAAKPEVGYLNRAKPFGFVNPQANPPLEPDYLDGYPYSSMKKLRLLSVLPVGWELAAQKINETDEPATLGDVLDGWDKFGPDGKCGTGDEGESRFCGLVSPDWLIKAPTARCDAVVYGPLLDASGTGRREVCADLKHCVASDNQGQCQAWGYCAREKNIWRFDGDDCDRQYVSCDTFKSKQGRTISVLENTVDFAVCSAENAGCARYSKTKWFSGASDITGTWVTTSPDIVYLDDDTGQCDESAVGCTEFIKPNTDDKVHYRIPPDYLHCDGENDPGQGLERQECGNYSRYCREQEVGCKRYTPKNGDSPIPGIITALDKCDKDCAGYDTYIKQPSRFEPKFDNEGMYLIIPQNAAVCSAQQEGCEEFTNLRTEQRQYFTELRACQLPGPDSAAYFTWEGSDTSGYQLKTWMLKKSDASALADDDIAPGQSSSTAHPPCTDYSVRVSPDQGIVVECTDKQVACDQNSQDLDEAADCRAFYDVQGNIYYRRLSQTIISTDECQSFRWSGLTRLPEVARGPSETADALRLRLEQEACGASHGSWTEQTKQCIYVGAPSLSQTCGSAAYGCRGFKGNAGSNTEEVFPPETFDPVSTSLNERGWSAENGATINYSGESLKAGEHSLKITANGQNKGVARDLSGKLQQGSAYLLTLLAKGTAGSEIEILLGEANFGQVSVSPEWRVVEVGPLVFENKQEKLIFKNPSGDNITFFIDEINLKETPDNVYLIKHSWDIPLQCDTLPAEAGGGYSRGAMLGCRAYDVSNGSVEHLKSFSRLCRDVAVGCEDLIDTRNSASPLSQDFNVDATDNNAQDDVTVPADIHRFVVLKPENICRQDQKACQGLGVYRDGQWQTRYLRNDPDNYGAALCKYEEEGCNAWTRGGGGYGYFKEPGQNGCEWKSSVVIGDETYSGWFKTEKQNIIDGVGLVNTKEKCSGYGSWNSSTNACVDNNGNSVGHANHPSWLSGCDPQNCGKDANPSCVLCAQICRQGSGGEWAQQEGRSGACKTSAPCYGRVKAITLGAGLSAHPRLSVDRTDNETYLAAGASFGIWRQGDAKYDGRAGSCPAEQATCAEFRDPTDTSADDAGEPYYFKENARLQANQGTCNGQVSRQAGCVLFINSENSALIYSAEHSYQTSEDKNGALSPPEPIGGEICVGGNADGRRCIPDNNDGVCTGTPQALEQCGCVQQGGVCRPVNDTNIILKVIRDRECSEWIQCRSAKFVWSETDQEMKAVCSALGRCSELPLSALKGGPDTAQCGKWITAPGPRTEDNKDSRLTLAAYQDRDKTFNGPEYVGYSIPDVYPIEKLQEYNLGDLDNPDFRLAYVSRPSGGVCSAGDLINEWCVAGPAGGSFLSGTTCTTDANCSEDRACVTKSDGTKKCADRDRFSDCRGFAERASPFPNTTTTRDSLVFAQAPLCLTKKGEVASSREIIQCGCDYKKIEYGGAGVTRYYNSDAEEEDIWQGICVGGTNDGHVCSTGEVCRDGGGECHKISRRSDVVGWQGFCLENDASSQSTVYNNPDQTACLSWWPVDVLKSAPDIDNQFASAGYQIPEIGGQYWCLQGDENKYVEKSNIEVEVNSNENTDHMTIKDYDVSDWGIRKYDIKAIGIRVDTEICWRDVDGIPAGHTRNTCENSNGVGAKPGQYYVVPGSSDQDASGDQGDALHVGGVGSYYHEAYEAPLNPDDDFYNTWWWGGDDDSQHSENEGRGIGGEKALTLAQLRDAALAWDLHDAGHLEVSCGPSPDNYWDVDEKYDGQVVIFYFNTNPLNQRLEKIRVAFCNGDDGGEAYEYQGRDGADTGGSMSSLMNREKAEFNIQIVLHPQCRVIAGIDPKTSAPWTGKLWSGNSDEANKIAHTGGMDYKQSTPLAPFGSSTAHAPPPISGTNNPWFLNINRMESQENLAPYFQFAGWPFACSAPLSEIEDPIINLSSGVCVNTSPRREYPADTDGNSSESDRTPTRRQSFDGGKCGENFTAHMTVVYNSSHDNPYDDPLAYNRLVGDIQSNINVATDSGVLETNEYLRNMFYYQEGADEAGDTKSVNTSDLCEFFGGQCEPLDLRQCSVNSAYPIEAGSDQTITDGPIAPFTNANEFVGFQRGATDFTKLFANVDKIYNWVNLAGQSRTIGKYIKTGINTFDARYSPENIHPPSVLSLTNVSNRLSISDNSGRAIDSGFIVGQDGFLPITLQFYANADNNHMPLRQISIDWDDGTWTSTSGLYRNHVAPLGEYGSQGCHGQAFSAQNEISCEERPFEYSTVYFCAQGAGDNWVPVCPVPSRAGGCCVFSPAVQVRDNWGYCNGGGWGDMCNRSKEQPCGMAPCVWTKFNGAVIVIP